MAGIEPATDGLRNRCSTAELHWHPLSINSHVANVLYFGRVKVNGKPIRQASGPAVAGVAPPAGVANELAPDTNARTICSTHNAAQGAVSSLCGRVAEWLKAPDSKSGVVARLPWVRIPPLPPVSITMRRRCVTVEKVLLIKHRIAGEYFYRKQINSPLRSEKKRFTKATASSGRMFSNGSMLLFQGNFSFRSG